MMITYSKIKDNAILLLALTGITSLEFEILLSDIYAVMKGDDIDSNY